MRLKNKCINANVVWAVLRQGGRKRHFFTRHRDGAGFATLPLGALEIKMQRSEVAGWGGRRGAHDAEERDPDGTPTGAEFCHFLSLLTKKVSNVGPSFYRKGFCHGAGVCLADSPTIGEEGRAACASWCPLSHFMAVRFWGCCGTCCCWDAPGGSSISSYLGCAPRRGLLTGSQRFKYWGWPVGVSFAPCRSWWSFPYLKEETTS